MKGLIRQAISYALALACTWWILFVAPGPSSEPDPVEVAEPVAGPVSLQIVAEQSVEVASLDSDGPDGSDVEPESEPEIEVPLPPVEAGSRDGSEDGTIDEQVAEPDTAEGVDAAAAAADEPEVTAESQSTADGPERADAATLANDAELLDVAAQELAGTAKLGFSTALHSLPEDQLDIAKAFGELLVLVPRAALDPEAEGVVSYRLDVSGTPRIVEVGGRPPLERYRQYRDLFHYEFKRLPRPLRTLRNSVVRRDQVYLFAALIPVEEWAIVVGRRREAVLALGVEESDVERYVLRYVRLPGGRFDFSVDEVTLADGRRLTPPPYSPQSSARSGRASR